MSRRSVFRPIDKQILKSENYSNQQLTTADVGNNVFGLPRSSLLISMDHIDYVSFRG